MSPDFMPRSDVAALEEPAPRTGTRALAEAVLDRTPINILIVDDEPKNLTALATILEDPRYQLVRAGSADEALLMLVKEEFALIILDIHMPGMSGFELAHLIKQRKKTASVPIIFLTAYYSEDQHVLEGYETGAVDYLHKPINPKILKSKVAVFVELFLKSRALTAANRALLDEIEERRKVQQRLVELNDELEQRVEERTADLVRANLALKDSEERLRLAQTVSGSGVWDWQAARRGVWWSESMWEVYGTPPVPPSEVEDLWYRLLHPEDRERMRRQMSQLLSDGTEDSMHDQFRIVRPNGETRWIEIIARVDRDAAGRPLRMLGVNADISERKRLEEDLRSVADELFESDRRKDQFLAMLAHELRNPLAPIRNAVEILRLMPDNVDAVKSATTLMDRQVVQMVRLVDDLLDVSRISRGKIELRVMRIDLLSAVGDAVEAIQPTAKSMEQSLDVSMPMQPILVNADPTRLTQLVGNLLHNACKFTPQGGRISLDVACDGTEAQICVADTGIGISDDQLSRIFDMFVQGDTSLERTHSGLGIGLTLVKQLAEMHAGTVEARSAGKGMGSEFIVRLPVAADAHSADASSFESQDRNSTTFGRIMVVDDNRDSAESLARLLSLSGNTAVTAFDGFEALETGAEFLPSAVILDIGLPGLNGYDTARQIRQQPWGRDVAIIALTGWGKDEDRRRSSEAGFNDHLVKPVDFEQLNSVLTSLLVKEG